MTCCDAEPILRWAHDKHPEAKLDYSVDFSDELARYWKARTAFAGVVRIRSRIAPGFEYECTTPGRTGAREPRWPTVIGQAVSDGSCVWTCRAPSTASLVALIVGMAWSPEDPAIVVSAPSFDAEVATAFLEGGVDGRDYKVKVTATCSNGRVVPQVCLLRVRIPKDPCSD